MNWITLSNAADINAIKEASFAQPQLIFKHSTRCSISSMAKSRLERATPAPNTQFHYLDLIANRNISALIADTFDVEHESPQVLLIKKGECVYDESHSGISMDEISEQTEDHK